MALILHLEDDVLDHKLVRAHLSAEGFDDQIVRVETEHAFLDALRGQPVDLILSDFNLSNYDGASALRAARRERADTPFIVVSGAMGETAAVEILKSGATDVVLKDRLERLGPAVRRAFRERQERDAREKAEAALRRSESGLRMMIESVRDYAIFSLDPAGNITGWNVGAERLFGYAEAEILGQPGAVLFAPEARLADVATRELRDALERGSSDDEYPHQRRDGTRFFASSAVTPVRSERGELIGFTKVARDVTERRRHEQEIELARDAAEQASRSKDQFLAVLSHELRTPLTPVLTTAQIYERDETLDPRAREAFRLIRRNVELETRLIDDLLDLTRVSRGKMTLNVQDLDLHTKVRHIVEMVRAEADDRGVRIETTLEATVTQFRGDGARVQQVIWNLLKNAIKFTPSGGRVTVRTRSGAGRVELSVVDTGIGIEPKVIPSLFNAFQQGGDDVTRLYGGLGLGLAISKAIVDLHHGTLSATSEGKDRGATFTVSLPLTAEPAVPSDDPANKHGLDPSATAANCSSCRVLYVEDNADTAGVMRMLLEASGHQVTVATSVADALKVAGAEPFELLISDIGLPDGSGLDLMRQLRHRLPGLRGIALSGFGMEEDVRRSLSAGFSAHLTKPIDIDMLEATVARVTAGTQATA